MREAVADRRRVYNYVNGRNCWRDEAMRDRGMRGKSSRLVVKKRGKA